MGVLPAAPQSGERPTLLPHALREWLRAALIVSLAVHAIVFLAFQLRFEDDLERAAGAAAAFSSEGTITIPVEVVAESMLPSAPAPTDASASDAEQPTPTPPIEQAEETPPEIGPSNVASLMPPPPEPAPVVLPEARIELPPPPDPAPVILPTQQEAMDLALPEEETAKPLEAKAAAIPEAPAAQAEETPPMPQPREPVREVREEPKPAKQTMRPPAPQKSAPSRAASPSRAAGANSAGSSGAGGTLDAGGRAAISSYQAQVLAHLSRHRVYPPEARASGITGVARVQFSLGRNGQVLSASLAGRSGHGVLDEAALAMARRASPFPAFPPAIAQSRLAFGAPIRFDLR